MLSKIKEKWEKLRQKYAKKRKKSERKVEKISGKKGKIRKFLSPSNFWQIVQAYVSDVSSINTEIQIVKLQPSLYVNHPFILSKRRENIYKQMKIYPQNQYLFK